MYLCTATIRMYFWELKALRGHSLRKLPVKYPDLVYGGRPAVNVHQVWILDRLGVRWTACCERSSQLLIFPQSCDDGSLLCTSDDRYTNPNGKLIVALFTVVKGRKLRSSMTTNVLWFLTIIMHLLNYFCHL